MPDTDTRTLLLQLNATTELMRSQLTAAERSVQEFTEKAEGKLLIFDRAMETASEKTKELGAALGFTAGLFAVEGLVEAAHRGLEYAASLGHMSQQIGVTTKDLQIFRFAASQTGISTEDMDKGLQKFTRSLGLARTGSEAAAKVFKALGFTDADIAHLDVHDALLKTADGIASVHDRATRAVPEVALFSKAGQQLDPLFSQGAEGIAKFAEQADKLGVVIPEEFIEKAHAAEARVAALKAQLSVNIAGIVAQNADAIVTLANSLGALASKILQLGNGVPGLYRIFQKEGFGAAVKSFVYGGEDQVQARTTEGFAHLAIGQYNEKLAEYKKARRDGQTPDPAIHAMAADVVRFHGIAASAVRDLDEERARAKAAEVVGGDSDLKLTGLNAPKGRATREPKGKSADELAKEAKAAADRETQRQKRVTDESARLDDQALSARSQLTANADDQLALARQRLAVDTKRANDDLDAQVKDGQVKGAEETGLRLQIAKNALLQSEVLDRQGAAAKEQAAFAFTDAQLATARDLLGVDASLAHTRKDRLAIALRALEADKEAERTRLQHIATDRDPSGNLLHSDSDIAVANANLSTLDARYAAKGKQANAQYESPLAARLATGRGTGPTGPRKPDRLHDRQDAWAEGRVRRPRV